MDDQRVPDSALAPKPQSETDRGAASANASAAIPGSPIGQSRHNDEAEEFAYAVIRRAVSLTGVKIDRAAFLRAELKKHSPSTDPDLAIATSPISAGAAPQEVDAAARAVIDFETRKCAAISFAAGIPGGIALAGTVPADLAQYFAHVMRVEQKLAYLYGWQTFLDSDNEIDDQTILELAILMGVMLGVGGAASRVTKFATDVAKASVAKAIERQALTKTSWYPLAKKILRAIGVNLTKNALSKTVSKIVPVIGGAISGGLTYASFKPSAERLRRHLRALPLSGIDPNTSNAKPGEATAVLAEAPKTTGEAFSSLRKRGE